METLTWKINGEFICNIARSWFWDEDKPYEKCEALLLTALGTNELTTDEKKQIAQDILEGRKILKGINECELVDDNQEIRPISMKLKEVNRKLLIHKIMTDMEIHPLNYIDPYSTVKSIRAADEFGKVFNYHQAYEFFCFNESDYKKEYDLSELNPDTMCGLWLLHEPELVADNYEDTAPMRTGYQSNEFWDKIYEGIMERNSAGFRERNERFLANKRMQQDKISSIELVIDEPKHDEFIQKPIAEMTNSEFSAYIRKRNKDDVNYDLNSDEYQKSTGLISPSGEYYSCDFGGHALKAHHLLAAYYNKFGYASREDAYFVDIDNALGVLYEKGWIALRYLPYMGEFIDGSKNPMIKRTSAQKNAAWDAIVKHHLHCVKGLDMIL